MAAFNAAADKVELARPCCVAPAAIIGDSWFGYIPGRVACNTQTSKLQQLFGEQLGLTINSG